MSTIKIMLLCIALVMFAHIVQQSCMKIPIEEQNKTNEILYNCAINIFYPLKIQNVLIQTNQMQTITYFAKRLNSSAIMNSRNKFQIIKDKYKFDCIIVIVETIEDFQKEIELFYHSYSYNPQAKLLVVFSGALKNISRIFEISWRIYALNIVLIIQEDMKINFYTYFPYANNKCNDTAAHLMGTCDYDENLVIDYFPNKIPLYLQGCPVRILAIVFEPYVINPHNLKQPGLEVTIFNVIAEKLNVTPIYVKHNYSHLGFKFAKSKYSRIYQMLYKSEGDVILGNVKLNSSFHDEFSTTIPLFSEGVVWFAPISLEIAPWKNFLIGFQLNLWIVLFVTFLILIIAWWIFGIVMKDYFYKKISNCFMIILGVLLFINVSQPKKFQLRILFISWVFSALLVSTTYNTKFTSILTNPYYDDQISNEKEILQSGLEFGFDLMSKDEFKYPNDPVKYKIYENHIVCPHEKATTCINRTIFHRDLIYLKNRKFVLYYLKNFYKIPTGKSVVFPFKEPVYKVKARMLVNQGFPLLGKINDLILRIHRSGLLLKWNRNILSPQVPRPEEKVAKKITYKHLQGAFFILYFGHFLSSVVFIIEKIIIQYAHNNGVGRLKKITFLH